MREANDDHRPPKFPETSEVCQHLVEMNAVLLRLEKLEREIERLKAFVGMDADAETKGKRKGENFQYQYLTEGHLAQ